MVIAIIALLAALLLPALRHVRYSAKTAICAGRLRQLGVGILIYCSDSGTYYPYTCKLGGDGTPNSCTPGAYSVYCRAMKTQQIRKQQGSTIYYTQDELYPYYGGAQGYSDVNTCRPHTPGYGRAKVPITGFRQSMSTYSTFWWINRYADSSLDPWRINGAMRRLGERWRADRRYSPWYQWYNVMAADVYNRNPVYDPRNLDGIKNMIPGPHSNHPNPDGTSIEWQHGQSENGWAATYGPTSVNSLTDDGAVTYLSGVTASTSNPDLGGWNGNVVPRADATAGP